LSRKVAREKALQALFQIDLAGTEPSQAIKNVLVDSELDINGQAFTQTLVTGAVKHLKEIDSLIKEKAVNWHLDRISNVEKAVLRIAVYELLFLKDVPPAVSINEAVNLVKVFGSEKGASFVNAILDKIAKENAGE